MFKRISDKRNYKDRKCKDSIVKRSVQEEDKKIDFFYFKIKYNMLLTTCENLKSLAPVEFLTMALSHRIGIYVPVK